MPKKNVVIVESPAKAKTIAKYLGSNYSIKASFGHIRDLPAYKLGVNLKENFEPHYINLRDKAKVIKDLEKTCKKADKVFIATDPDREGEAIAWHIQEALKLKDDVVQRIVFNEITKKAVTESIHNCRDVNMHLVDAQQARRVLDRLIGYKLSPILSRKIQKGLSAGRVQSVAVKMICDREKEILAFIPKEYWVIEAELSTKKKINFFAKLFAQNSEKEKLEVNNEKEAKEIVKNLDNSKFSVSSIKNTESNRNPAPPFITSSLQQDASRKFNWSAKKTMYISQQLYEGVEIDGESLGLITYMRTDSFRISNEAKDTAKDIIKQKYGANYLPSKPNFFKQKKNVQDAHEAIRPSYVERTPEELEKYLAKDHLKLYKLIWDRFIASQMKAARLKNTQILIEGKCSNNNSYLFKTNGHVILFDGFKKVYQDSQEKDATVELPNLTEKELLDLITLNSDQKFTQPPSRFTEATLVKEMEENGIGRPSTYAPTISTILDRDYVNKDKRNLLPTDLGMLVNDKLQGFFSKVINTNFTADMENLLDEIIEGKHEWQSVVGKFYDPFAEMLTDAYNNMEKIDQSEPSDEICDKCSSPMVIRNGKFGKFISCTKFPECKNTISFVKPIDVKCPNCDSDLIERYTRKGKMFYGCSKYPECKYAVWDKPILEECPKCKNPFLLIKKLKNGKELKYCEKCAPKKS
jgi:DNA topoisomerase I